MNKRYAQMSVRKKLVLVFSITAALVLIVNLWIQHDIDGMITKIDMVYGSNISLNDLQAELEKVQASMKSYLDNKSSGAMESYFSAQAEYAGLIKELNPDTMNNESKMMEKNIRSISETYLAETNEAVEAKRGRNVEKYKLQYEKATQYYTYIQTYLYSLNNEQFKNNSRQYSILTSTLHYTENLNLLILLTLTVFNIAVVFLTTKQITAPLYKLSDVANQVSAGNFEVEPLEVDVMDEVGVVTKAFNKMLESVKRYIAELTESMEVQSELRENELRMETHLKDAQLKYLQAQINPHFLFNTLNAGAQLAMMEEAPRSYEYIQNVADFFRYSLKSREEVTLAEELELVDHYIYILNVRFSNEIHFYKTVDESLTAVSVPSMILQPIVENSVNYGIRDMEGEKRIELEVFAMDHMVCVSIRDNGVGITEEKIRQIMQGKVEADRADTSNGVGMNNVLSRLRLYFGMDEVMEITRIGEEAGTEVTLYLPYVKN